MDTTYIKQCDCPEIQEQRSSMCEDGDIFSSALHKITVYSGVGWEQGYIHPSDLITWLPRQDDLQKMLEAECPLELLNRFYRWIDLTDIAGFDNSMEQLWLAFVMSERYQKIWEEDKWIKGELSGSK